MSHGPQDWTEPFAATHASRRSWPRLRRDYFSYAAETATRYRVGFDRLVHHLWAARRLVGSIPLRRVHHLNDLALVCVCLDGDDSAWRDLVEQHERALVRHARSEFEPSAAIVHVRRTLHELEQWQRHPGDEASPLTRFVGDRSLRHWLAWWIFESRRPTMAIHQPRPNLRERPSRAGRDLDWRSDLGANGSTGGPLPFPGRVGR